MRNLIFFLILFSSLFSCNNKNEDYTNLYSEIFIYSKSDSCKYSCTHDCDTNSIYYDFNLKYWPLIGWVHSHYFVNNYLKEIDSITNVNNCDSVKINLELSRLIAMDKIYNEFFIPFYKRYKSNNISNTKKPEITIDSIVALTSRFYFAQKDPNGDVYCKVCMAANPYSTNKTISPLQMELGGFGFLVVRNSDSLWNCFEKYAKLIDQEVKDLHIADSILVRYKSDRISESMRKDETLKNEILSTYDENSVVYGFIIKK